MYYTLGSLRVKGWRLRCSCYAPSAIILLFMLCLYMKFNLFHLNINLEMFVKKVEVYNPSIRLKFINCLTEGRWFHLIITWIRRDRISSVCFPMISQDVTRFEKSLSNLVGSYMLESYNHFDVVIASDAKEVFYDRIVDIIGKYQQRPQVDVSSTRRPPRSPGWNGTVPLHLIYLLPMVCKVMVPFND